MLHSFLKYYPVNSFSMDFPPSFVLFKHYWVKKGKQTCNEQILRGQGLQTQQRQKTQELICIDVQRKDRCGDCMCLKSQSIRDRAWIKILFVISLKINMDIHNLKGTRKWTCGVVYHATTLEFVTQRKVSKIYLQMWETNLSFWKDH